MLRALCESKTKIREIDMGHKMIGQATKDHRVTSIRKQDNGIFTVEFDGKILYSAQTLDELKEEMDADGVTYSFD